MTRIRIIPALLGAAVLAACSKDGVTDIAGPTAGSFIKFYNLSVNAPSVNFFANDAKMTAISSTSCSPPSVPANPACTAAGIETTTGTAYGLAASGGFYSSIAPGQYTISGKIPGATDNGIAKVSSTLADAKYYSFYMSGFYDATAKTTDAFILEDAFPVDIDFTSAYVKFVNASSNSNPMTLYAKNTATGDSVVIASAIAYKSGGAFVKVPPAVYDLTVRYSGSNTAVVVGTGVSLSLARVYTVIARGDMTVTSTASANRPLLTTSPNR